MCRSLLQATVGEPVRNSRHEVELALQGGALSHTEPLVHIQVHGSVVDALGLVVADKVNSHERGPCPRVGEHVEGGRVSCKTLLTCAVQKPRSSLNFFCLEELPNTGNPTCTTFICTSSKCRIMALDFAMGCMSLLIYRARMKSTCRQQMDGVNALDVGSHVLNPRLQIVSRVVGDVVNLRPVCGLALSDVELCLGAGLVHQVVPEDGRVLPADTASAEHTEVDLHNNAQSRTAALSPDLIYCFLVDNIALAGQAGTPSMRA